MPSTFMARILPIRIAMNMQEASKSIEHARAVNNPQTIPRTIAIVLFDFSSYSSSESFIKKPDNMYEPARIRLNNM